MQLNPYLNFDGQCAEAFRTYEKVLGGRIEMLMTNAESPMADQVPAESRDHVMHARMTVGDTVIMGSDAPAGRYSRPQGLYISINVDRPEDARRIFNALADGGSVHMPFEKTFWAAGGFGMLADRFGIPWMINCEKEA